MRGYRHLIPEELQTEFDELLGLVDDGSVTPPVFLRRVQWFFRKACNIICPEYPDLIYRDLFGDLDADIESQLAAFSWESD